MKILQLAVSAIEMTLALTLGFSCALGLATLWLRAMLGAITRNSYNVSNVADSSPRP